MKYYSEMTKKFYESEEACLEEEERLQEEQRIIEEKKLAQAEERKARAAAVEEARDIFLKARENYNELLKKFCADYGFYHYSLKNSKDINDYLNSLFNLF